MLTRVNIEHRGASDLDKDTLRLRETQRVRATLHLSSKKLSTRNDFIEKTYDEG